MSKQKRQPPNPDLLDRLWADMSLAGRLIFDRRVSGTAKLIPLAMIAYILSPLDLIPDLFLPLGIVDDLSAFLIGLQLFIHSAPPGVLDEYRGRTKVKRGGAPDSDLRIIEGEYEVKDNDK